MGAREECADLVRKGITPAEIARRRGVSKQTIYGYIDQVIGRGDLRRSDVAFTVARATRRLVEETVDTTKWTLPERISKYLERKGTPASVDDVETLLRYGSKSGVLGEMYEDIRAIEVGLHQLVRVALEGEYGKGESGWWRKGVPEAIRMSCHRKREQDPEPVDDPYRYTDLVELREVLVRNWDVVARRLPPDAASDRRALAADLLALNVIRRNVTHPVRGVVPDDSDFEFVRSLRMRLRVAPS